MPKPTITIGCVSNLFSRMLNFRKTGDTESVQEHTFDHLALLARGKLTVRIGDKDTQFTAPHQIYIAAGKAHEFIADSDDTLVFCIHALRTGERAQDILDPDTIPAGSTALQIAQPLVRTTKK